MDSIYYKDENCGKYCKKELIYCDCKGKEHCVIYYEPLPYKQAEELLPPIFISDSLNSNKYCNTCVMDKPKICKGSIKLTVKHPMKVGDLWSPRESKNPMYYVYTKDKFKTGKGHYVVYFRRLDKSELVESDLKNLSKKTALVYRGYTN